MDYYINMIMKPTEDFLDENFKFNDWRFKVENLNTKKK